MEKVVYECNQCGVRTDDRTTEAFWLSIEGDVVFRKAGHADVKYLNRADFHSIACLQAALAARLAELEA